METQVLAVASEKEVVEATRITNEHLFDDDGGDPFGNTWMTEIIPSEVPEFAKIVNANVYTVCEFVKAYNLQLDCGEYEDTEIVQALDTLEQQNAISEWAFYSSRDLIIIRRTI